MTAEKALLLMSDIIKILVGAIKEYAIRCLNLISRYKVIIMLC